MLAARETVQVEVLAQPELRVGNAPITVLNLANEENQEWANPAPIKSKAQLRDDSTPRVGASRGG